MINENDKSSHILNASSNLLGICFIILTSLKILGKSQQTIIDEIVFVAIVFFMASCYLSFLSIRSKNGKGMMLEKIADGIFLGGLTLLFVTTVLFAFNVIE